MRWFKKRRSDDAAPIVFATRAEAEAAQAKQAAAGLEPGYGRLRNASGTYYVFRGNDTERAVPEFHRGQMSRLYPPEQRRQQGHQLPALRRRCGHLLRCPS